MGIFLSVFLCRLTVEDNHAEKQFYKIKKIKIFTIKLKFKSENAEISTKKYEEKC